MNDKDIAEQAGVDQYVERYFGVKPEKPADKDPGAEDSTVETEDEKVQRYVKTNFPGHVDEG